jgi:hypothetical protein
MQQPYLNLSYFNFCEILFSFMNKTGYINYLASQEKSNRR